MNYVRNAVKVIYGHISLPLSENDRFRTGVTYGNDA
ncbi:hypothetical protein NBRC3188_3036 [Acetobacter pasteurianus NBRC 3188]|uniref:Uncharacterized protein n=1 Tax=Acetobacter pasteurianus NBRC 3188 TaxID=1226663 RepID=A0A401WY97_ACEPA|nr:hypothetical protein NBRC3188_3036 [Acetobacter pasteurianus NBRC 3188]